MKKAIIAILMLVISFTFLFGTTSVAYAEESVANGTYRANSNITVYTYIKTTEIALFEIPSTYYFEIYDSDEECYYIKYNSIEDGLFIKKTAIFVSLDSSKDIGTLNGFSIELSLLSDTTLYAISSMKFNETNITVGDTTSIVFVGFGTYGGKDCAYVLHNNNKYGYIAVENLKVKDTTTLLKDYVIDLHPNYRATISDTTDNDKSSTSTNKLTRTLLIVGIVIPALIIVLLLFMPRKQSRYDYDRNHAGEYGTSPYDRPRSRYDNYPDNRQNNNYNDGYGRDEQDGYYDNRR